MGLRPVKPCDPDSPIMLFVMSDDITVMRPLAAIISDGPEAVKSSLREQCIMLNDVLNRDNILAIRTSSSTWGDREMRLLSGLIKR